MRPRPVPRARPWPGLLGAAALAACATVGPDYEPPDPGLPAAFAAPDPAGAAPLPRWWSVFDDPELEAWIERARTASPVVSEALARLAEARALRRESGAERLPAIDVVASAERRRRSAEAFSGGVFTQSLRSDLYELGFDASWELDLFGGLRRGVEAADADLRAAEEALRDVLVSISGDVAREYVEMRGGARELEIVRETIGALEELRAIVVERVDSGLTPELDLARVDALLFENRARVPELAARIQNRFHALATLAGEPAGAAGDASPAIPVARELPSAGVPAELLRRRPDLRRAERELAAATARIGVAAADLYPRITLTGSYGWVGTAGEQIFESSAQQAGLGPGLRWPLFDGGRARSRVAAEEARASGALARFQGAVLGALREVEDALASLAAETERRDALERSVESQERALVLASELYSAGLADFVSVIDVERELLAAREELARSQVEHSIQVIALCKALGGGWDAGPSGG
jgi:NodT family efflux transporter outer membrane factor (OMF) lipoprotein